MVDLLAADKPLPCRNVDQQLTGEWRDHRDCHLRPDLVLIYRLSGADILELVRLGSFMSEHRNAIRYPVRMVTCSGRVAWSSRDLSRANTPASLLNSTIGRL